jgi:hypothetical protein
VYQAVTAWEKADAVVWLSQHKCLTCLDVLLFLLPVGLFARLVKLDPSNEKNIRKAFKAMPAINACGFVEAGQ